jgi:hypothetical protein
MYLRIRVAMLLWTVVKNEVTILADVRIIIDMSTLLIITFLIVYTFEKLQPTIIAVDKSDY